MATLFAALNLASSITPPLARRLEIIDNNIPFVSRPAAATAAIVSIFLWGIQSSLRRGYRIAHIAAILALSAAAVLNILKALDIEEAAIALLCLIYLVRHRSCFNVQWNYRQESNLPLILGSLIIGISLAVYVGSIAIGAHTKSIDYNINLVVHRLWGDSAVTNIHGFALLLLNILPLIGILIGLLAVAAATKPIRPPKSQSMGEESNRTIARSILKRLGTDTLSYFSLRDDKNLWLYQDAFVAYDVIGSMCIVSPDPICAVLARQETWTHFFRFALQNGWSVIVLGASADWLPIYKETGFNSTYMGDEAIIHVRDFRLDTPFIASLRKARNRVARHGYTVEFVKNSEIDKHTRQIILGLTTDSRKNERERGFSMTLSRVANPEDVEMMLTLCRDKQGALVAFCQFVPSLTGWSLDVMHRDRGIHPNGLLDFALCETIFHVRETGAEILSLNFVALRDVLSGHSTSPLATPLRWFINKLSRKMQIATLYRFNAKFFPTWHSRYAAYFGAEMLPLAAIAIGKAEGRTDIPFIGRLFAARTKDPS